jgi:DNA-binding NarL/FixJ family response regulator
MMDSSLPIEFTAREKQIALMLLKGEKRAAMAGTLRIHVRTVDFHLWNLRRKARVKSLIELAIHCARLNGELKH